MQKKKKKLLTNEIKGVKTYYGKDQHNTVR